MKCDHCNGTNPPSFNNCCHCRRPLTKKLGLIDKLVEMNPDTEIGGGGGAISRFGSSTTHRGVDGEGTLIFIGVLFVLAIFGSVCGDLTPGVDFSIIEFFTG